MHLFEYPWPEFASDPTILGLLAETERGRGAWEAVSDGRAAPLSSMASDTRIMSTLASNAIEGIRTTPERGLAVAGGIAAPCTHDEREIAGYRDALTLVQENHGAMEPTPGLILQLHRDLYRRSGESIGGRFKDSDNVIAEVGPDGALSTRFKPVSASRTPDAVEELCRAWSAAHEAGGVSPLLLCGAFVLDFTCIHPFSDGNGRMSRILTQLLLLKDGYDAVLYSPLEAVIERRRPEYYDALQASSMGWHENASDPRPFLAFHLEALTECQQEARRRLEGQGGAPTSKGDRVVEFMAFHQGPFRKADILAALPDISEITVKRVLAQARRDGLLELLGSGRSSAYLWRGDVGRP